MRAIIKHKKPLFLDPQVRVKQAEDSSKKQKYIQKRQDGATKKHGAFYLEMET